MFKVSVSLITYNQEMYIAQAIESVLSQETNFPFELVISDDASSDKTFDIIKQYAEQYPNLIRSVSNDVNLGLVKNALKNINECQGEYIALLEGDDYWVDNKKLQKQADFLDGNPDCACCFTNGRIFWEGTDRESVSLTHKIPAKFSLKYFLDNHISLLNNTKMFRKSVHPNSFDPWFYETVQWDWTLHVLHARKHSIGYLDFIGMDYRRHDRSFIISSNKIELHESALKTNACLDKLLNYEHHKFFKDKWWHFEEIMVSHLRNKDYYRFIFFLCKAILDRPFRPFRGYRDLVWKIRNH